MSSFQQVLVEVHPLERLTSYWLSPDHSPQGPVLVEGPRGRQLGWIRSLQETDSKPFPECIPASRDDLKLHHQRQLFAAEVQAWARRQVTDLKLPMKIQATSQSLSGDLLILYFSAPERLDFRPLVKALAQHYRKKIELYQLSARQRSQLLGGQGRCGLECCCTAWLQEFPTVSVRMAEEQGFSLQAEAISGVCGRFLCCLRYEYEQLLEQRQDPQVGDWVETPEGQVKVLSLDPHLRTLQVENEDGTQFCIPWGRAKNPQSCRSCQKGTRETS